MRKHERDAHPSSRLNGYETAPDSIMNFCIINVFRRYLCRPRDVNLEIGIVPQE